MIAETKEKRLAIIRPDLAKEWHPTKNGELTPFDVTYGSGKKVWWYLPYDDPRTGKHFDFEWQETVNNRNNGNNCPFLSGQRVWHGFNDLVTTNPDLAREWHPTKNGSLLPSEVSEKNNKKVWWYLPYDDPKTGKHFDFEWQEKVSNRALNCGCPYLTGHAVWRGYNDLATTNPDLAKEWHPTKNSALTPFDVTGGSQARIWWLLPYDDPQTGKHFDFEWQNSVCHRVAGQGCPFLSHNPKVWKGFNDLVSVRPDLAKEWHPTKNKGLTPNEITIGSSKKVWWLLPYDDPKTGKHFDFEWKMSVCDRIRDRSCPFLSVPSKRVWSGFNDLATLYPELVKEWHPTKNGTVQPQEILSGSEKKFWWLLPYDDPQTGKHFEFEWQASAYDRSKGVGCPFLTGKAIWLGFNDLATTNPELAKEWHPEKNRDLSPSDVSKMSNKEVWWYLPYDDPKTGRHYDFEWKDSISHRSYNRGCPFISQSKGEQHIRRYFDKLGLSYMFEKTFPDLIGTGNKRLSYDYAVIGNSGELILFEYQGIQHYMPNDYFGGESQFKIQKEHDHRKRKYAEKHGYPLIEIPYKYETYDEIVAYINDSFEKIGFRIQNPGKQIK